MKLTHTSIAKLLVQEVEGLPEDMRIILESTGPKRGVATVRYGSHDWSSFWNAMPQKSIAEFFAKAPCDYLVDNMTHFRAHMNDYGSLKKKALIALLKQRRKQDLSKDEAREHHHHLRVMQNPEHCAESLRIALEGEWWHFVETMPNPIYEFAEKVMSAAQAAVRQAITEGVLQIE
jgi:hypothetical protein